MIHDLQFLYLWQARIFAIECERDWDDLFMKEIDKNQVKQIEQLFLWMYDISFRFSSATDALTVFQARR